MFFMICREEIRESDHISYICKLTEPAARHPSSHPSKRYSPCVPGARHRGNNLDNNEESCKFRPRNDYGSNVLVLHC